MTAEETFRAEVRDHITETFSKVAGMFLNRGTSLLETLTAVSAEQASKPNPANGETVAAHVFHLVFYQRVVREYVLGTRTGKTDWDQSWVVKSVTPEAWRALLDDLRSEETQFQADAASWKLDDVESVGGLLNMLQHTAFHLACIRQVLDSVR